MRQWRVLSEDFGEAPKNIVEGRFWRVKPWYASLAAKKARGGRWAGVVTNGGDESSNWQRLVHWERDLACGSEGRAEAWVQFGRAGLSGGGDRAGCTTRREEKSRNQKATKDQRAGLGSWRWSRGGSCAGAKTWTHSVFPVRPRLLAP